MPGSRNTLVPKPDKSCKYLISILDLIPPGGPLQPVLAPFSLNDNTPLAFNPQLTSVTSSGLKVSFTFATNRPSLVYYRLVINVNQVGGGWRAAWTIVIM